MQFEVRALKGSKGFVTVVLEAPDMVTALEAAASQGLSVLSAKPVGVSVRLPRIGRPSGFSLLQFSQELVALLRAGLALPETLETMVEKEGDQGNRVVAKKLRDHLFEGHSLSQAMCKMPDAFTPLYVATVKASERTGDLAEALARFVDYQERLDTVRKKIVSASIYPVVLIAVGGLVTLFLLAYVVPRFSAIYSESGRNLPFLSRVLLEWGQLINLHAGLVTMALALVALATAVMLPKIIVGIRVLITRVPAIGSRLRIYYLARFYRSLGMLLRGGTPIVPALILVQEMLPRELRDALLNATRMIGEGKGIADAMVEAGLGTTVAARMMRVGESTGDMAGMLERVAAFHDDEMAKWVDWFTKLFEPILMALIGVVIGAIVVLMYMPIFELAGSLQ